MRMVRQLLLLALFIVPVFSEATEVHGITEPTHLHPKVQEFLTNEGIRIASADMSAKIPAATKDLENMVKGLLLPKDGTDPIYVFLYEDLRPGSFYIKMPESDQKVIGIATGLFSLLKNDDEVKFILGNELEHGVSELRPEVLQAAKYNRGGIFSTLTFERMLSAEDNEFDLKSTIERLHFKGSNPYAAYDVLEALEKKYGNEIGFKPMNATRKNAVAMALTALTREFGEKVNQAPPSTAMSLRMSEFINGNEYQQFIKKRFAELMSRSFPQIDELFNSIKEGKLKTSEDIKGAQYTYGKLYKDCHRELERYINLDKLQLEIKLDFENQVHAHLAKEFHAGYDRLVNSGFTVRNSNDVLALIASYQWDLDNSLHIDDQSPRFTFDEDDYYKKYDPPKFKKNQDKFNEEFPQMRTAFDDSPEVDQLIAKINYIRSGMTAGDRFPPEWALYKNQLKQHLKYVGPEFVKSMKRFETLVEDAKIPLLKDYHEGVEAASLYISSKPWSEPYLGTYTNLVNQESIEAALDGYIKSLKNARVPSERMTVFNEGAKIFNSADPIGEFIGKHLESNENWGKDLLQRFFKTNTKYAMNLEQLNAVMPVLDAKLNRGVWLSTYRGWNNDEAFYRLNKTMYQELITPEAEIKVQGRKISWIGSQAFKRSEKAADRFQKIDKDFQYLYKNDPNALMIDARLHGDYDALSENIIERLIQSLKEGKYSNDVTYAGKLLFELRFPYLNDQLTSPFRFTNNEVLQLLDKINSSPKLSQSFKGAFHFEDIYDALPMANRIQKIHEYAELIGNMRPIIMSETDANMIWQKRKTYIEAINADPNKNSEFQKMAKIIPSKYDLAWEGKYIEELENYGENILRTRVANFKERARKQTNDPETADHIFTNLFFDDMEKISQHGGHLSGSREFYKKIAPTSRPERIRFTAMHTDFYKRTWADVQKDEELRERSMGVLENYQEQILGGKLSSVFHSKSSPEELVVYFTNKHLLKKPSLENDENFLRALEYAKNKPHLKERFLDENFVQMMKVDSNRLEVARWQLAQRFDLKAPQGRLPTNKVRAQILKVQKVIEKQFPKASLSKDLLIDEVSKELQANPAEAKVLGLSRTSLKNIYSSKDIALLDLPSIISTKYCDNNKQRWQMMEYLLGIREEPPEFVGRKEGRMEEPLLGERNGKLEELPRNAAKQLRAYYRKLPQPARTFVLQSFLDDVHGFQQEPGYTKKLYELILGSNIDDPIISALFSAYLEAVPRSEKNVILGHVLSAFTQGVPKAGVSVAEILSAMGPMGVRAGQFIHANGLASPEVLKQLEVFYDASSPPFRWRTTDDLEKVFGDDANLFQLRDLKGSGSINYGVHADFFAPNSKKEEVLLRFQRDGASGRIENENAIWEREIAKLTQHSDPQVRKIGFLAEEARLSAYQNLGPGGTELDLSQDRNLFPEANAAYTRVGTKSGFKMRAAKPADAVDALIKQQHKDKASAFELIDFEAWKSIKDESLRKKLAEDVVQAELDAILGSGFFDSDGHPGNWLVDLNNKELVRVDYSQFTKVAKTEVTKFRDFFSNVVMPGVGPKDTKAIASTMNNVFDFSEPVENEKLVSAVETVLGSPGFQEAENVVHKVIALRNGVEAVLSNSGQPNLRVRLTNSARSSLVGIGKLQAYKNWIGGEAAFKKIILSKLSLNVQQKIYVNAFKEGVKRRVETVRKAIVKGFQRFRQPKSSEAPYVTVLTDRDNTLFRKKTPIYIFEKGRGAKLEISNDTYTLEQKNIGIRGYFANYEIRPQESFIEFESKAQGRASLSPADRLKQAMEELPQDYLGGGFDLYKKWVRERKNNPNFKIYILGEGGGTDDELMDEFKLIERKAGGMPDGYLMTMNSHFNSMVGSAAKDIKTYELMQAWYNAQEFAVKNSPTIPPKVIYLDDSEVNINEAQNAAIQAVKQSNGKSWKEIEIHFYWVDNISNNIVHRQLLPSGEIQIISNEPIPIHLRGSSCSKILSGQLNAG